MKIEKQYRNWRVWFCAFLFTSALILEMSESDDLAIFIIVHLVGLVIMALFAFLANYWETTGKIKLED